MPSQLLPVAQQPPMDRLIADCRVHERTSCALPTTCQPASALEMKEIRWAATIADISVAGVRIVLQRRFEKGSGLAIELPGDGVREPTVVFVKVMHVRAQPNAMWALGCRFLSELGEDEMQRLLTSTHHVLSSAKQDYEEEEPIDDDADTPVAAKPENRPEPRFLEGVFLKVETQPGTVVDCLIKRLNVSKCWPLKPGKILSLNGKSSDQLPWSLRIQITLVHEQTKGWEIEGRIVGTPTADDIFLALGRDA